MYRQPLPLFKTPSLIGIWYEGLFHMPANDTYRYYKTLPLFELAVVACEEPPTGKPSQITLFNFCPFNWLW